MGSPSVQHEEEDIKVGLESESTKPQDRHQEVLHCEGTSLVVQWLRLHAPNARGLGWIPGQGAITHIVAGRGSPSRAQNWALV